MHELSLLQDILEAVVKEAEEAGGKRVKEIRARLRESAHHMEGESLAALMGTIAKGTLAEGAEIRIEVIPPTLACKGCGLTFQAHGSLLCPGCQSGRLEEVDAGKIDLECDLAE